MPPAALIADPLPEVEEVVGYRRSPSDVIRLLVFAAVTLALLGITRYAERTVRGVETDIVALFSGLDTTVTRVLNGFVSLSVGLIALAVFIPPILTKRYRLIGYIVLANAVTFTLVLLANWWLSQDAPNLVARHLLAEGGLGPGAAITPTTLAEMTSSFVILAPFVGERWRRTGLLTLVGVTVTHIILAAHLPSEIFVALALGATVGTAVLLAFGRPDRRPTPYGIRSALTSAGLEPVDLEPFTEHSDGTVRYLARLANDERLMVKVLSPDEHSADLLYRFYRFVRLKNLGDERPFSSMRQNVEHEALVSLQARDVGVRTPRLRGLVAIDDDSMLVAYDFTEGRTFDEIKADELTESHVRQVWDQLARMRTHRIGHRDLRRSRLLLDPDGMVWLTDFSFSEVATTEAVLDSDTAQLLAVMTLEVGVDRAVTSAADSLGVATVGCALPRLQANALSSETRAAFKRTPDLLEQLQHEVANRAGVDEPEYVPLERISRRTIFTILMLVAATYFLLPKLADLPGIFRQVSHASWGWAALTLVFSTQTYVGAAAALAGSVPERLKVVPNFLTQVASSFASNFAPAGVGGMALKVRYLQQSGVDAPVAVSSVGLNTIAGFAMHVASLIVFFIWAGRSEIGSVSLPRWPTVAAAIGIIVALLAIAWSIPPTRRWYAAKVRPVLAQSIRGFAVVIRSPGKILLLFGGSGVVTLGYVLTMYFSTLAFGGGLSFPEVAVAYLAGSAIATAAPTPGGLGALEAAVIAGLVGAGMANTTAVPAVFLFRLATFWLPMLPGWVAFHYLRRERYL
ncbi:MAG: flippase-like domain-containing protein [Acidimicrobiia bacterium]|nr:flippase-like domain-containing protein [Acidimicrobiia bacterium]